MTDPQIRIRDLENTVLRLSGENRELQIRLNEAKKLIDDVVETCNHILDELRG